MSAPRRILALAAALAAFPTRPAAAQSFLDQGTFVIRRDSVEVGREEFAVRATATGQGRRGLLAVATDHYRDREIRTALELTGDSVPATYQVDVTAAGRLVERLSGQLGRGRFGIRLVTQRGEKVREFPVPRVFAVLGEDGFPQYAFLPRPRTGETSSVALLLPRQSRMIDGVVRGLGLDTLVIGSRAAPAEHFGLTLPGGAARDFWVTASGELIQVAIPSRAITATRLSLPRH